MNRFDKILWMFLLAVCASIGGASLLSMVACAKDQPPGPVYDPPPIPGPVDPPTPGPTPQPTPDDGTARAWSNLDPLLVKFAAGTAVSKSDLDTALGATHGDRNQPMTPFDRVVTYRVRSADKTTRLNVFVHFAKADAAAAKALSIDPR